jgi:hypothetical protein
MKKSVLFFVLAAMLAGSVPVLADGMFYWREPIPPRSPTSAPCSCSMAATKR